MFSSISCTVPDEKNTSEVRDFYVYIYFSLAIPCAISSVRHWRKNEEKVCLTEGIWKGLTGKQEFHYH